MIPMHRRQPRNPSRPSPQVSQLLITIAGVDTERDIILCRDNYGTEFEIDASVRRKGQGYPAEAERWVLTKRGGRWILDFQIGAPTRYTVEGTREGLHPVTVQVLEALSRQGLLFDGTIGGAVVPPLDDVSDPPPPIGPDEIEMESDEPWIEEDPDEVPEGHNGPKDGPEDDDGGRGGKKDPWHPIFLGSFNQNRFTGNQRVRRNMVRMTKSRMSVVGWQEMAGDARDGVCESMGEMGWNYYRPKATPNSDENTIFWREGEFTKLDEGWKMLSDDSHPPGTRYPPPRHYVWVKLRHRKSKREFYFISTHLLPYTEGWNRGIHVPPRKAGHPSTGHELSAHMDKTFSAIAELRDKVQAFGRKAPVFLVGDMNIDFFADRRVRHSRFPYAQWSKVNTRCNWDLVKHRPNYATGFGRYIDHIWVTRPKAHQVRFTNHWVLTGYYSDHRPVMVKAELRDKSRDNRRR